MGTQLIIQVERAMRVVYEEGKVLVYYTDAEGEHIRALFSGDELTLRYDVNVTPTPECVAAVAGALALGGKK